MAKKRSEREGGGGERARKRARERERKRGRENGREREGESLVHNDISYLKTLIESIHFYETENY